MKFQKNMGIRVIKQDPSLWADLQKVLFESGEGTPWSIGIWEEEEFAQGRCKVAPGTPQDVCPRTLQKTCLLIPVISQQLLRQRGTKTTEQLTFSDGCETLIKSNLLSPVWRGLLQKNKIYEGDEIDQRISQLDLKCSQMGAKG